MECWGYTDVAESSRVWRRDGDVPYLFSLACRPANHGEERVDLTPSGHMIVRLLRRVTENVGIRREAEMSERDMYSRLKQIIETINLSIGSHNPLLNPQTNIHRRYASTPQLRYYSGNGGYNGDLCCQRDKQLCSKSDHTSMKVCTFSTRSNRAS
jgi:hypothetical protein